ncbi:MAG: hypothetical protein RLZZ453_227 [Chlamydiota bacterium]|jgi:amino acid transporter
MKKIRPLSAVTLTMINIAAIGSVKNWPLTAEYGFAAISYVVLALLCFFLPTAFVTAELSTAIPRQGGIYAWIKMAFGHRLGFLGIFLFWLMNVVWYPTILSFIAATLAYLFNPGLLENKLFVVSTIISTFWIATFLNMKGLKMSGWVSTLGALGGTFIPGVVIIALGITFWLSGKEGLLTPRFSDLIPPFSSLHDLVFFVGIILSFTGIEMSAIHAKNVQNPQRSYFLSTLFSSLFLMTLTILGVLAIATVVPHHHLSLVSGTLQAFAAFLPSSAFFLPCILCLMIVGAFGSLSSWMMGASQGLLAAATQGDLPPYFRSVNKRGIPSKLLIGQGIIVSLLSLLFALIPSLSTTFWILSALVTQLYLIVYLFLFATAIRLRFSHPLIQRPYRIKGLWIWTSVGILTSLFAIFIGFIPPPGFTGLSFPLYTTFLLTAIIISCLLPSIILLFQKPNWSHEK